MAQNVNADIRSVEVFSEEESLIYGEETEILPLISRMCLEIVDQMLLLTTMDIQEM
jgi:hypothetical protein